MAGDETASDPGTPDDPVHGTAPPGPEPYLDPDPEMQRATLVHVLDGDEMLLMEKRRGVGAGNLIAPGGKLEPGETPRAAARREVREELGIDVENLRKAGELAFEFGARPFMFVEVFDTDEYAGEPQESEEAIPEWHPVDDLPYDRMWEDDEYWLPHLVAGRPFAGRFKFDADGEEMLDFELEIGVEL